MSKRIKLAAAGAAAIATVLVAAAPAFAGLPTPGTSGTHGCVLADGNGTAPPQVYPNSGTSQIGGSSCTVTAVNGVYDSPNNSYFAAAKAWSVSACTPGLDANGNPICTPDGSWSSANGDSPVGKYLIKPGDQVTAWVSDGTLIVGTVDGDPGA